MQAYFTVDAMAKKIRDLEELLPSLDGFRKERTQEVIDALQVVIDSRTNRVVNDS